MVYTIEETELARIIEMAAEAGAAKALSMVNAGVPASHRYDRNGVAARLGMDPKTFDLGPRKAMTKRFHYGSSRQYWTEEDVLKYEKSRVVPAPK